MDTQRLKIGAEFPKISLTDIENKTITIPDDIKTKYCILIFQGSVVTQMHPSVGRVQKA